MKGSTTDMAMDGKYGDKATGAAAGRQSHEPQSPGGFSADSGLCYDAIYSSNLYCIYVHDIDGRFLRANRAAMHLLGYTEEELRSAPFTSFLPEEHISSALRFIEYFKHAATGENAFEIRLKRKDGEYVWVEAEASLILQQGLPCAVQWVARDITSRKKIIDDLHALSLIDDLTGLYNRRGFLTLAEKHIGLARRIKKEMLLLFADIDGMKTINDTLGHLEGDRALIDAAEILRKTFRETDIIGRIGGDEFAVLAIGNSADVVTKRLQENIESSRKLAGQRYFLSMSAGVTVHNAIHVSSVEALLETADRLMYRQKRLKQQRLPVFDSSSRTGRMLLSEAFSNIA